MSASRSSSVRLAGVGKAFHDARRKHTVVAIDGLDLEIPAGQFVCLVGPSGCGKSTLLRLIAGLERQTVGTITFDPPLPPRRPPAVVFQEHGLLPWLTIERNVGYPLRFRPGRRADKRRRVGDLLALTGLEEFAEAYPHQVSGGMRQRASVARALADETNRVLLMDEPFGALDEQTRLGLQQELLGIWERSGTTVLFITHSVDEALSLGDRVIVMSRRPARIVADRLVGFERPRDVLSLRRDPRYGAMAYEIWSVLERDLGDRGAHD